MKFSIGDPVYIISNNEEGKITEFIGNDMACVKVKKGSYHAFLNDLEHPYLRWFLDKKKQPKINSVEQLNTEKKSTKSKFLHEGVFLVFFPQYSVDGQEEKIDKVKLFFYNETDNEYNFSYQCKLKTTELFALEQRLYARSEFYLHDISFEEIANTPNFIFNFIDTFNEALDFDYSVVLKPKKLFEYINAIRFDNKAFFHIQLFEKIMPKPKKEIIVNQIGEKKKPTVQENHFTFSNALQNSRYEIDLHIEKLYPNYSALTSTEMLDIQLKEFQNALDLAIATHQKTIIFIHGVGKGVLKNEIHLRLNQTKWVHKYVNSYDVRYGYGATEVFFLY